MITFTLLGLGIAIISLLNGASPIFFPLFVIVGAGIDRNRRKNRSQ